MNREIKAIYIIWLREIIRYWRNKTRAISGLAMPVLWIVVMGSGLSSSLRFTPNGSTGGFDYINFIFPGIIAMTLLFSSVFSALSLVYDREFGFFKEIFVAPISRTSIVLGKVLGGATTATIQASLMFFLAPIVGITLTPKSILLLLPAMFLVAFGMSSLGILIASRMKSTETFPMVMQFIMMPMFFLSGALFPLREAPGWLSIIAKFNPLTYGVNLLRGIIFSAEGISSEVLQSLNFTILGQTLTYSLNLFIFLGFALVTIFLSVLAFKRI